MNKGIIFSTDAVMAVIVLALFTASMAFLTSKSSEDNLGKLLLKKQSSDLLLAMDKTGLLAGADQNRTNQTLQAALSPGAGYDLKVEYYEYTGGNMFNLNTTLNCSRGNISSAEKIDSSQRSFVIPRAGKLPLYGAAKLSLWQD